MSRRYAILAVGVILLALGSYAVWLDSAHGQAAFQEMPKQWDYQVVQESAQQNQVKEIRSKLVRLGAEGWEVCGVSSNMSAQVQQADTFYIILKRPKQ